MKIGRSAEFFSAKSDFSIFEMLHVKLTTYTRHKNTEALKVLSS